MPNRIKELIEKRTQNAKHFLNDDGTITAEIGGSPKHYKDASGAWQDIDTTIQTDNETGFTHGVTRNSFHAKFNKNSVQPIKFDVDGKNVTYRYQNVNNVQGVVEGNKITYPGAYTSTDIVYYVNNSNIKGEIHLKDDTAPLTFSTQMQMQGVTHRLNEDKSIDFIDSSNNVVFSIPRLWVKDSSSDEERYDRLLVSVKENGSKFFLDITLDDTGLTYPIVIDPTTITPKTLEDTMVYEGAPSSNYGSDLTFQVGAVNGGYIFKAYLNFEDLTIASSSIIESAFIKATVDSFRATMDVSTYQVTSSWAESTITWNSQPSHSTTASSTTTVSASGPVSYGVKSIVQNWVNNGQADYGIMCYTPVKPSSYNTHNSSESTSAPYLEVTYSPNSATAPTPLNYNGSSTSPERSIDLTPTLDWSFSDAEGHTQSAYRVQVTNSSGTIVIDTNKIASTATHHTTSTLTRGVTYHWRAMTWDSHDLASAWSNSVYFKINTLPTIGSFLAPTSTSKWKSGSAYTVDWGSGSDGDGDPIEYLLDFYDGATWTTLTTTSTNLTTSSVSHTLPSGLATTSARYRVRAYDGYETSGYSYSDYFEIYARTQIATQKFVRGNGTIVTIPIFSLEGVTNTQLRTGTPSGAVGTYSLVATTDAKASPIRVQTSTGIFAIEML